MAASKYHFFIHQPSYLHPKHYEIVNFDCMAMENFRDQNKFISQNAFVESGTKAK
jgi:hypothetical protein